MADNEADIEADNETPIHQRLVNFAFDVANGRHAFSDLVPSALSLADALLCAVIIKKVPCELDLSPSGYFLTIPDRSLTNLVAPMQIPRLTG